MVSGGEKPRSTWGVRAAVVGRLGLCAACVLLLGLALAAPAKAQETVEKSLLDTITTGPVGNKAQNDQAQPMLLQADQLVYDNQRNRVTATGNVEIYYNNYAVLADRVTYDQAANTLFASGNVRVKEPSGSIISADQITLTDDLRDGFIQSLRVVTKDDVRIAAQKATRTSGDTTVFENGVFTPCKPCQDHPEQVPIWRIRADRITHKQAEGNIYFQGAAFDLFGQPIAYVPYFYAPDPSVKRRTGFLAPSAGYSQELGYTAEVPYFWAIAPNMDITFDPMYMSKRGVLAKATWRHRLENGTYKLDLAGIQEADSPEGSPTDSAFRGSVVTEGDFALGSWWDLGWDATLESDDTFRRFYKLDSVLTTDRVSEAHLVGLSPRNYLGAYVYHFGGLLATDNANAESNALPSVDYHYIVEPSVLGGELSFDANALSLSRNKIDPADLTTRSIDNQLIAKEDDRFIAQVNWRSKVIDPLGEVFTPFAMARGDLYYLGRLNNPADPNNETDQSVSRGTAAVGLTYELPFVAHAAWGSQVIEPVAQIVARPSTVTNGAIPNEDAQSFVFDDTLLFDIDKFSGYDRIETGTRANVGVQYTAQANNGGSLRAVVGESFQLAGDNPFGENTGLENARSDYVVGLYLAPNTGIQFVSQSRFDSDTFELRREDLSTAVSMGPAAVAANYSLDRTRDAVGVLRQSQEILTSASLQLNTNWSLVGSARYNIDDRQMITDTLGVRYVQDCIGLSVTYSESNVQDQDVAPDRTVLVRLDLKYLGGTTFRTDTLGVSTATSAAGN